MSLPAFILTSGCIAIIPLLLLYLFLRRKLNQKAALLKCRLAEIERITKAAAGQSLQKEKHIGQLYATLFDHVGRLEKVQTRIARKAALGQHAPISASLQEINIKKERIELGTLFDQVFLSIFPDFIEEFNAVLKPEDQLWPTKSGMLPRELRMHALMRLGIHDSDQLSGVLEYTPGTISVYKSRMKAKVLSQKNDFEQQVRSLASEKAA